MTEKERNDEAQNEPSSAELSEETIRKNRLRIQLDKHNEEVLKLKLEIEALKKQQKDLFK